MFEEEHEGIVVAAGSTARVPPPPAIALRSLPFSLNISLSMVSMLETANNKETHVHLPISTLTFCHLEPDTTVVS